MFDTSAAGHDFNIDNGTFVVDASANRVGIGTATPSTLLDVNGTATATTFIGALTGNVTGNVSGTAATVTGAAQTNITSLGTLTSLTVDDITIDGSTISDAADLLLDVGGDISLDADGGDIRLLDGGTQFGKFTRDGGDFLISSSENDKDIKFAGADGGANITALTLDMSAAGEATFNSNIISGGKIGIGTGTSTLLGKLHIAETAGGAAGVDFPIVLSSDRYQADYGVGIVFRPENLSTNYAHKTAIMGSGGGYGYNFADILFCFNESTTVGDQVSLSDAKVTFKKNGNVGIGETSPQQQLVVKNGSGDSQIKIQSGTSNDAYLSFNNGTTLKHYFKQDNTGLFELYYYNGSTGVSRIAVKTDGNVGIGTDNPGSTLHVDKANVGSALVTFHQTAGNSSADRGLDVETSSTGTTVQRWLNSGTELARITGTGRFGIGSNNPSCVLEVESSGEARIKAKSTNNNWAGLDLEAHSSQSNYIFFRDNSAERARIQVTDGNEIKFNTTSSVTERMRIYSDGKVDIKNGGTDKIVRFINTGGGSQGVTIGTTTGNSAGYGVHIGHQGTKAFIHPYNYGAGAYQQMEIACSDFVLKVNGSASGMTMDASAVATFYGDVKINDANDRLIQNGTAREAKGGYIQGNQTVSFTINHTGQSVMHVRCGFNHYGLLGYGCVFDQVFANGPGGMTQRTTPLINDTSSLGGAWSLTRVDGQNVTVSKSAGSYVGGGYYYIIVEGANL